MGVTDRLTGDHATRHISRQRPTRHTAWPAGRWISRSTWQPQHWVAQPRQVCLRPVRRPPQQGERVTGCVLTRWTGVSPTGGQCSVRGAESERLSDRKSRIVRRYHRGSCALHAGVGRPAVSVGRSAGKTRIVTAAASGAAWHRTCRWSSLTMRSDAADIQWHAHFLFL